MMKKDTTLWALIGVLFVAVAVLFTLQMSSCSQKYSKCNYKKYSRHHDMKAKHLAVYDSLCEKCQLKVKDAVAQ